MSSKPNRMILRITPALAFATGCVASGPLVDTDLPPVPVSGHTHIRITADDGSVRVFTADVAQIEVHAESSGYDVRRDLDLSITPRGDQVDIVARILDQVHIFDLKQRSLHVEVRIPRDADVEVSSGDGAVEVEAITGALDVGTGDGDVTVSGARGSIRLHTGDGSITGRGLDGSVDATTGDGSVDLTGRFDGLTVATGDGELVANAATGSRMVQPWHLQTHDGSVTLGLSRDLAAHIDASSSDGSVHSTIPLSVVGSSRAEGDVNGGGPSVVVRTGDGSIQLIQL